MGLHNPNDWRYNQGPGNLFNTYLGNSPSTRVEKRVAVPPSAPQQRAPVIQLIAFLHHNASAAEVDQFLERVATSKGIATQFSKRLVWSEVEKFARMHLTKGEIERYLAELQRRKTAGEPLIRAK